MNPAEQIARLVFAARHRMCRDLVAGSEKIPKDGGIFGNPAHTYRAGWPAPCSIHAGRAHLSRGYGKCSIHFVMAFATGVPTVLEKRRSLPIDAMIPDPIFTSTHAITIDAPPEQVWPWIAQMGSSRAGWYSWDAIDNGGRPRSTSIVPALQTVILGDIMPAVPGAEDAFVVAAVDAPRDLMLGVPDGHGGNAVAWEHVLEPSMVAERALSCGGGFPHTGSISPGGSRLPVTGASSSSARMRYSRDCRIRC